MYEALAIQVARHPSESEARLVAREVVYTHKDPGQLVGRLR